MLVRFDGTVYSALYGRAGLIFFIWPGAWLVMLQKPHWMT